MIKKALLPLLSAALFSGAVSANNEEQKINQAILDSVKMIKARNYASACDLLDTLPAELHTTKRQLGLNSLFLKGQCHAGLGLNEEAKQYFEQLVELDPKSARPYLDLALVYQYLGEYSKATDTYEQLLELDSLSEPVRDNVEALLAQRPDAIKWQISGSLGSITDSNINNAPTSESIKIYGTEFIFNSESRPTSTAGIHAGFRGYVSKLLDPKTQIEAQVVVDSTLYGDYSDFDSTVMDLSFAYKSKRWGGEVMAQPRMAMVTVGGNALLDVMGADFAYSTLYSPKMRLTSVLSYQGYAYSEDAERDTTLIEPRFMVDYQLLPSVILNGRLTYGMGAGSADQYSFTDLGLGFGVNYYPFDHTVLSLNYDMNNVSYDAIIPGFEEVRTDTQSRLGVQVSYNFAGLSIPWLTADLGFKSYTNSSNIALFDNTRTQGYLIFNLAY